MAPEILIADDHASIRLGIKALIAKWRPDWKFSGEATNGEEAVQSALSLRPDVILMDLGMPVTSGLEATLRIARLGLRSCVVLLTAQEASVIKDLMIRVGAKAYVDKANLVRDLIPTIEKVLAERALIDVPADL